MVNIIWVPTCLEEACITGTYTYLIFPIRVLSWILDRFFSVFSHSLDDDDDDPAHSCLYSGTW
jgi:hypothetical protein